MRLLDRKLIRDLLQIRWRILALVLINAAGVGIFFAINLAISNIRSTQDTLLDAMQVAEIEVQLLPEDRQNLPDFSRVPHVKTVESRLVFPGHIDLRSGKPLNTLMIFQDKPEQELNRVRILQGRFFKPGAQEIVIDKALAEHHGYAIGDKMAIKVGNKTFERTVAGVVMSPEFLVTSSNPEYVVAEPGSLGVIWGELADLRASLGFTMVNSLLFHIENGADPQKAREEVANAVRRLNVERIVPREEAYSTHQVRMELKGLGIYTPAIILMLLLLSIAMGVITFRRFVVEKKREIAVLMAMGLRRKLILAALLRIGLVLGFCGALVGLALGWGVGCAVANVYADAMKLPIVIHRFDLGLACQGVILSMICGTSAVFFACRSLLNRMPRELLTEQATVTRSVGKLFAKWPTMLRMGVREMLRQRELSLASILAMGGAIGVAISYGLAMTSNFETVDRSFQRDSWDYAVDFRYPLYEDEASAMLAQNGVTKTQPYLRSATELRFGGQHAVGILSGQTVERLHTVEPSEGREIRGASEAIVSHDLMRALGAKLGDRIRLEKGSERLDVAVVGITHDIFLGHVVVSLRDAQTLAQFPEKASGYYVMADQDARNRLIKSDTVARVTDRGQLHDSLMRQMREKMGMVYIIIVFALIVSMLFVTTLVYLSITEKRAEYAILRSLGFGRKKMLQLMLSSVGAQLLLGLLIAAPIGVVLVLILNARMSEAWYAVDLHLAVGDFALPMLASILIAPIVGVFSVRAILKLNIPDYLRGRAI